jgi:hypothetical protein
VRSGAFGLASQVGRNRSGVDTYREAGIGTRGDDAAGGRNCRIDPDARLRDRPVWLLGQGDVEDLGRDLEAAGALGADQLVIEDFVAPVGRHHRVRKGDDFAADTRHSDHATAIEHIQQIVRAGVEGIGASRQTGRCDGAEKKASDFHSSIPSAVEEPPVSSRGLQVGFTATQGRGNRISIVDFS